MFVYSNNTNRLAVRKCFPPMQSVAVDTRERLNIWKEKRDSVYVYAYMCFWMFKKFEYFMHRVH